MAARADKYAVVRTLSHREYNHLVATHHTPTGHQQPGAFFDKVAGPIVNKMFECGMIP